MRLRIITDHDGPDGTRVVFSTESGVEVTFIPRGTADRDRDPAALLDCELPTLHSISLLDQITHVGSHDPNA
jgi:hypothetical protein